MKDFKLSFGDIIALAADFYYRWRVGDCQPSISNDWDSDPSRSLNIAAENVNLLRTDSPELMGCVRPLIQQQGEETKDAYSRGQDIAQVRCLHWNSLSTRLMVVDRLTRRLKTSTIKSFSDVELDIW